MIEEIFVCEAISTDEYADYWKEPRDEWKYQTAHENYDDALRWLLGRFPLSGTGRRTWKSKRFSRFVRDASEGAEIKAGSRILPE